MLEGRRVLGKNAFLRDLEKLLKDAGIKKMGCIEEFHGRRDVRKHYVVLSDSHVDTSRLSGYLDVTNFMEDFDGELGSTCTSSNVILDKDVIYADGIFYEKD